MSNGAVAVKADPAGLARAEPVIRRLLMVPEQQEPSANCNGTKEAAAHRMFNLSIAMSGLRCLLGYVVLPVITPALGAAAQIGPVIGIPIGSVALVFDVMAVRRFWVANHRWRWGISLVYLAIMAMVLSLLITDAIHLA